MFQTIRDFEQLASYNGSYDPNDPYSNVSVITVAFSCA
jgi:hypothetical protein